MPNNEPADEKKIIAIGGGKGGIGKSIIACNIGVALAQLGKKVVLIDADLGGANLHLCLGIKHPAVTLNDFIQHEKRIQDILLPTELENLKLIGGASGLITLANPSFGQKQRLIHAFQRLKADYLIIDLGAGTHNNVVDFFISADLGLVVMGLDPTSIENAYGFLKNCIFRKLIRDFSGVPEVQELILQSTQPRSPQQVLTIEELFRLIEQAKPNFITSARQSLNSFQPKLIMNMLQTEEQLKVGEKFKWVVQKYLDLKILLIGYLYQDERVSHSIRSMRPFMLSDGNHRCNTCIENIARNIIRH